MDATTTYTIEQIKTIVREKTGCDLKIRQIRHIIKRLGIDLIPPPPRTIRTTTRGQPPHGVNIIDVSRITADIKATLKGGWLSKGNSMIWVAYFKVSCGMSQADMWRALGGPDGHISESMISRICNPNCLDCVFKQEDVDKLKAYLEGEAIE